MRRLFKTQFPPLVLKVSNPLRFGILGAARIAPDALITPAKCHADVVVTAVACRDEKRGARYSKKHGIPRLHSGAQCYEKLVTDPDIDVVYIALPNALHFEWTMRAIQAGKHVLVEKPIADSAEEARKIFESAEEKGVVVLEAVHFPFHPATQRVKAIIDSGELGKVKSIIANFALPSLLSPLFFHKDDIRYSFDLGGGCTMDMGVYPLGAIRYLTGTDHSVIEVTDAKPTGVPTDESRVDRAMHVTYAIPGTSITAESFVDFGIPGWGPLGLIPSLPKLTLVVKLEGGDVEWFNCYIPGVFNTIKVKPRSGPSRTESVYKHADGTGESWWSSYRYQLEAFVDKVRGSQKPQHYWHDAQKTITQMECVERIYKQAGMPARITSSYTVESDEAS